MSLSRVTCDCLHLCLSRDHACRLLPGDDPANTTRGRPCHRKISLNVFNLMFVKTGSSSGFRLALKLLAKAGRKHADDVLLAFLFCFVFLVNIGISHSIFLNNIRIGKRAALSGAKLRTSRFDQKPRNFAENTDNKHRRLIFLLMVSSAQFIGS